MKRFALIIILAVVFFVRPGDASEFLTDSLTEAKPVKIGDKIIVAGFYFKDGSDKIDANLKKYLRSVSLELKKIKFNKLYVDGYTDNLGGNAQNNRLSRKRAAAVRQELIKNAIPAKKIQARAYGSSNPIAQNNTKNGRIQNRRVEILVR
ncbi:MAG: OmpA family protein [Endomicrobium sp.]|jgi:outer membrane protein OmpA-like peptidoglycan-associated protein|nr:OmpA family protein [Endomicrobium sp.]